MPCELSGTIPVASANWMPGAPPALVVKIRKVSRENGASRTVGGNANWYNRPGEQDRGFLSKRNTELLYGPAIPLPGVYPDNPTIQKDTCTSMFPAALFTIAKTRKQIKCPSTDTWIKMWYTLSHKKE